jgi:RNA polymerase subunit RPABC4/transcription elongation factor Spt4
MSWYRYRELAGNRIFRCSKCGRVKNVKYVPTSSLCRRCASELAGEKRRLKSSILVKLNNDITVTKAVERRLENVAQAENPPTKKEKKLDKILIYIWIFFWVSGYFIISSLVNSDKIEEFTGGWWVVFLLWCILLPGIITYTINNNLIKLSGERRKIVDSRIEELAETRKKRLDEARRFYSSPEWLVLRKKVIEEDGSICAECKKQINKAFDITVDHKYPRVNYPELALSRDNLRVLCRKCNSEKGSEDWIDIAFQTGEMDR